MSRMQVKIGVFQEGKRYSIEKIARILDEDRENAQKIVRLLRRLGVLKPVEDTAQAEYRQDIWDGEGNDEENDFREYKVVFVGLAMAGEYLVKCFPKYLKDDMQSSQALKQILKVLAKYKRRKEQFVPANSAGEEQKFLRVSLSLWFLEEYFACGFYVNEQERTSINGEGEIIWERTIDESFTYLQNRKPYYLELYTKGKVSDEENYIRRLHETILFLCVKDLERMELLQFLDIPKPEFQSGDLSMFGDESYILYQLRRERSIQFVTRKQELLQAMESFILSQNTRETKEGILLFGTSHFEYVWQDVCSFAFGDVLREKLKDLPGGLARKYLPWKEKRLQELIEKPVWTDKEGGISVETETWRPDGICIYPNNNGWTFSIQDAKYYCIRMGKDRNGQVFVEGQPGIGDVAKQYFYLLAYKDFIESQGYEQVKNVFLCPNTEERCQNEKSVKLETLGQTIALGEGRIEVIGLPVKEMFMLYLEGKKIDLPEQYLEG